MIQISHSASETEQFGARIAKQMQAGSVLAFSGDLGAGKTTFMRGFARALGVRETVTSPTYTIVNEYNQIPIPLIHFDLYRLSGADDLFEIGWDDYLERSAILAVEWAERAGEALPDETIWVNIRTLGADMREIEVNGLQVE